MIGTHYLEWLKTQTIEDQQRLVRSFPDFAQKQSPYFRPE